MYHRMDISAFFYNDPRCIYSHPGTGEALLVSAVQKC